MKKLFYPALFHKAEEGGFWVSFPDIPECLTQGDDMTQAYEMAVEALGLALTSREEEKQPFPAASDPTAIIPEPDSFFVVIKFDLLAYKKQNYPDFIYESPDRPINYNQFYPRLPAYSISSLLSFPHLLFPPLPFPVFPLFSPHFPHSA